MRSPDIRRSVCVIQHMPNEILSAIFFIAVLDLATHLTGALAYSIEPLISAYQQQLLSPITTTSCRPHTLPQSPLHFLSTLQLVCQAWSSVVNMDPTLWSNVRLDRATQVRSMSHWMKKSSAQPLDIVVDLTSSDADHVRYGYRHSSHRDTSRRNAALCASLDVLTSQATRWRSFTVVATCSFDMMLVIHRIENIASAPLLETLEIRADKLECMALVPADEIRWYQNPKKFFNGDHPLLERVELYGVPSVWGEHELAPFVRTACIESDMSANDGRDATLQSLLKNAYRMTTLSVKANRSYIFSDEVVHLPSLNRLDIEFWDAEFAFDFVSAISAKNLKILSLALADDDFTGVLHSMTLPTTLDNNILQNIVILILKDVQASQSSIDDFLDCLKNVTSISFITNFIGYKGIFKRLATNASLISSKGQHRTKVATLFCPKLSTIYCRGFSAGDLRTLVFDRIRAGCPLKEIHMTLDDYAHPDDREWLSANVSNFSCTKLYCRF